MYNYMKKIYKIILIILIIITIIIMMMMMMMKKKLTNFPASPITGSHTLKKE